jgi:hypothetical protein
VLVVSSPNMAAFAIDQEKRDSVRQLVELLEELKDAQRAFELTLPQSLARSRKLRPDIPQQIWDAVAEEAHQEFIAFLPEIEESFIAIYDANYSGDEIKQLLAFYRSPIGQKVIAQTPHILDQSEAVAKVMGERLRQRLANSILESVKRRGYEL